MNSIMAMSVLLSEMAMAEPVKVPALSSVMSLILAYVGL